MLFMNNHLFSHSFLGKIITHNRIAILLVEKEKKKWLKEKLEIFLTKCNALPILGRKF